MSWLQVKTLYLIRHGEAAFWPEGFHFPGLRCLPWRSSNREKEQRFGWIKATHNIFIFFFDDFDLKVPWVLSFFIPFPTAAVHRGKNGFTARPFEPSPGRFPARWHWGAQHSRKTSGADCQGSGASLDGTWGNCCFFFLVYLCVLLWCCTCGGGGCQWLAPGLPTALGTSVSLPGHDGRADAQQQGIPAACGCSQAGVLLSTSFCELLVISFGLS